MVTEVRRIARDLLRREFDELPEYEKSLLQRLASGRVISRNTNRDFDTEATVGQRVADRVAAFGGSWSFIAIFASALVGWVGLNSVVLARSGSAFDPYPYILLNLFLSMLAAMQAPVIMMSQNRQAAKDRLAAAHDYEINLKAEVEIRTLHEKLDELREQRWSALVQMQQDQIALLTRLLDERRDGAPPAE